MDSAFKALLIVAALVAGLWWWLRRKAAASGAVVPPPAEVYSRGPLPTGMAAPAPSPTYAANVITTPTLRGGVKPPAGVPNTPPAAPRPVLSMGSMGSVGIGSSKRYPAPVGVA